MTALFSAARLGKLESANRIVVAPMCQYSAVDGIAQASAIAWGDGWPVPMALDETGIARIVQAFANAARRADRAGLDFIELHSAHGYLMHSFLNQALWSSIITSRARN